MTRRRARQFLAAALAAATLTLVGVAPASAASTAAAGITPVGHVDIGRYLGTWKQIADIPQWYETFCVRDVTANYALNADGTVKVVNTCANPLNGTTTTTGVARVLDRTTDAQLQVSFLNLFGQQIYLGGDPNYVIIGLAPDYSWAVVGDPSRASGYVLSRSVTLSAADTATARDVLRRNGYDPCNLTYTKQTGGASSTGKFC